MKQPRKIASACVALLLAYASPCTAGDNTVGGPAAGADLTTGTNNTILGTLAGESVTTGTDNTLVGYKGGKSVTGNYNVMLGEDPSSAITSGSSNILIGNSLTQVTDTTSSQLDIGDTLYGTLGASGTITAANNFTVLGTIIGNLFSGSGASLTNLNGSNISSGTVGAAYLPIGTVITSTASPAQGDVLYYDGSRWVDLAAGTSGYVLETQGTGADPEWAAVSSGSGTVSSGTQYQIGYYASTGTTISGDPYIVTDSSGDLSLGSGSYQLDADTVLAFPDGDTTSIAVGTSALASQNVGGSGNSALGNLALTSITGGYYNSAVGQWALQYQTNGFFNTAVGVYAMQGTSASPLVGAANTADGGLALVHLQGEASNNTGIGVGAGASITTGTDNTLVGYAAGAGVTGNFNIMLGEDPYPGVITTGSGNILMGNSLTEVTDTSSNQLDIGDTIYGTLGDSGTVTVANNLTVTGNITIDGSCTGCGGGVFSSGQLQGGSGISTLSYCPYKGNVKTTASQGNFTIPSGCLTANANSMYLGGTASQQLSGETLYYIYLWNNSGTWVLDAETTGHSTNTTTGVEQESGDATKALVGMIYPLTCTPSPDVCLWDDQEIRAVATWDNRTPKSLFNGFPANETTTSTSITEINTGIRGFFLTWGDTNVASYSGAIANSSANVGIHNVITLDGTSTVIAYMAGQEATGNNAINGSMSAPFIASEGYHYITISGFVTSGTGTWYYTGAPGGEGLSWSGAI